MQTEIIKKKIFTQRVRTYLEKDQLEALIKLFSGAEEAKVAKSLLKKASIKIGVYLVKENRYYEAIIFFNKARIRDPKNKTIFQSFINTVDLFFEENVEEFSKKDLEEFKQAILPIINFHKVNFPDQKQIIDSTDHLFRRIDYRIKYVAKDVGETKVTFRVHEIRDSLYSAMTPQEIKDEFARIIEDDLRDLIKEKGSSKKKKKNVKKRKKND